MRRGSRIQDTACAACAQNRAGSLMLLLKSSRYPPMSTPHGSLPDAGRPLELCGAAHFVVLVRVALRRHRCKAAANVSIRLGLRRSRWTHAPGPLVLTCARCGRLRRQAPHELGFRVIADDCPGVHEDVRSSTGRQTCSEVCAVDGPESASTFAELGQRSLVGRMHQQLDEFLAARD